MTINWGHKITIVFLAFAAFILLLVYKSMHTDFQLVSKEYYKEELAYQQVIDGSNRANRLSSAVSVQQIKDELIVQLPSEMKFKNITGDIWLYCPTDDKKDRKLKLILDDNGRQAISTKTILPAGYLIKINWQADAQTYYNEQHLQIK